MLRRLLLPRYRAAREFVVHHVLHASDTPHQLAMGAAIGMFVTFLPLVGFQMMLVAFFAWLMRANKVIGLPIVWISNPVTLVPIYYACYLIGQAVLGYELIGETWWAELNTPPTGWAARVSFYWRNFMEVATPLWTGCLIVALVTAYPTYYFVLFTVRAYRRRHPHAGRDGAAQ